MSKSISYEKALVVDALAIAHLHKVGIPTGFLSKQSSSFLEALYAYLIEYEIVYVAKEDDNVVGFIAASINTSGLYKQFLKSNIVLLVKFCLQNIFSMEFIKKAYETLNAPKKVSIKESSIELPELLSIVVKDTHSGKGIGCQLISCIEKELIICNQNVYKVLVGANLEANIFYIKNGFSIFKEVELHEDMNSYIYVKEIGKGV